MAMIQGYGRCTVVWLFTAAFWPIVLLLHALTAGRLGQPWYAMRFWGHASLRLCGIRLVIENASPFDVPGGRVVIVNHQSTLDMLSGAAVVPRGVLAIAKKELVFVPVLNLAWWAFGFVFLDRQNVRTAVAAINGLATRLKTERRSLFVSPEGTRAPTAAMLPFKKGPFRLALAERLPIYPVVTAGAFELMPKSSWWPRGGVIRLRYLPPIDTSDWHIDELPERIEAVRTLMCEAYEELQTRRRADVAA